MKLPAVKLGSKLLNRVKLQVESISTARQTSILNNLAAKCPSYLITVQKHSSPEDIHVDRPVSVRTCQSLGRN